MVMGVRLCTCIQLMSWRNYIVCTRSKMKLSNKSTSIRIVFLEGISYLSGYDIV